MIAQIHASGIAVLVTAVFLACAVEMIEALTIVVAVGTTKGWRSAFEGIVVALLALSALVAVFGPTLIHVPLNSLRLVVGGVLLVFGLQWLRKAVLRSVGLKGKHDEDAIFEETVAELRNATSQGRDTAGFVMAFKGVFLEGLEVVITVITLGTSSGRLGLASLVAGIALLLVAIVGVIVAKQLSNAPENAMKMTVGIMLVSYGTFWSGEGMGIHWPGSDGALLAFVAMFGVATWLFIQALQRTAHEAVMA